MSSSRKLALIIASAFVIGGCFSVSARGHKDTRIKTAGYVYLEDSFSTIDKTQKTIRDYAEVGYKEYKSSALLAGELEKEGFSIEKGVAGIPTAFIARYGSGSPVIGLLGEYDALPGLSQDTVSVKSPVTEGGAGHGCGHNVLGVAPCYAAIAIARWLAEGHQGTVIYYGCPAEEGGGGKAYMTRDGCFNESDVILQWHPANVNKLTLDTWSCNMNVKFTFKGRSAHAGGSPWLGRSALDAVEAFDYMTNLMREHIKPESRIHYVITNGGEAPNVVPDRAEVNYYFRSPKVEDLTDIFSRALKAAEGAAAGTETEMSYEIINGNYSILGNARLAELMLANMKLVGGVELDEGEKEFCRDVLRHSDGVSDPEDVSNFSRIEPEVEPVKSSGLSSDVGNVSQVVPLCMMNVACFVPGVGGHCWQNVAVAGSTVGTKGAVVAAKVFYLTALDLLSDASVFKAVRDEFEAAHDPGWKYVPLVGDRKPPLDYRDLK